MTHYGRHGRAPQAEGDEHANFRELRRVVALDGFGALEDGTTFAGSVIDLSYDGCRIETAIALLPGVKLKISVLGLGGALDAVVRWCRRGHVGLKFSPVVVTQRLETPRKHDRVEVTAQLSLRRAGRSHYRARLFDLTNTGCKVEFIERPRREELLWAKFDGMDSLEAAVRWIDGFYGGLEFVRPIHPAVFELLLARLVGIEACPLMFFHQPLAQSASPQAIPV